MKYLNSYKIIFTFLVSILETLSISGYVSAQNEKYYFTHITESDNFNYGRITCLTKAKDGFIWFGTYNGLYRFDGYESSNFKYSKKDTTTLDNNIISSMFVDSKGTMWVGTFNGLNRFMPETETFQRYNVTGNKTKDLPVFAIIETGDSTIWCGTWGAGLLHLNPETGRQHTLLLDELTGLSQKSNNIKQIISDKKDNIYICTWGEGLIKYNSKKGTFKQFKHNPEDPLSIPDNKVLNIEKTSDGEYFVACKNGNVSLFSSKSGTFITIKNVTSILKKYETEVTKLKLDYSGNIYIATYGAGVLLYNLKNGSVKHLKKERNNAHSLSSNLVTDIYFSRDDSLTWIATINGINIMDPNVPKFRTFTYIDMPDTLTELNCQGFIYHNKDRIYIGTRDKGIWEFFTKKEIFKQYPYQHKPFLNSNNILSIAGKKQTIYAGTDKGLNIINLKKNKAAYYNSSTRQKPANDIIRCIMIGNSENIWMGSSAGLDLFNERTITFSNFKPYPSSNTLSAKNFVRAICQADDNTLWIGTSAGGLNRFNIERRQFTERYIHNNSSGISLSDNKVNDIYIDSKNYIWVATATGINRFDPENKIFKVLNSSNGLTNENIHSIEEDDKGNIWFSTEKSIVKLYPKSWTFKEYNKYDGVNTYSFNSGASLKLPSGKLIFGGVNGFNLFHPDSIKENKFTPRVIINDIKILNLSLKEYQKKNKRKITGKAINYIKHLNLKHYENSVSIQFAALNYSLPQKNQYKYILEGFDKKWISSNNRIATYTNLPPGSYTFRIRATNNDKVWSPYEKRLVINIEPPFYQTWIFRLILLSLIILTIIFFNKFKTYKIKRQKEQLEKVVVEKTRELMRANMYLEEKQEEIEVQNSRILSQKNELEKHKNNLEQIVRERTKELEQAKMKAENSEKLKTAFLANMSHEIRTPMNAIVGFSTLLNTPGLTDDEREEYINHIKENSEALLVLIDDLLDLSQIESGNMYVRKEEFVVKDLVSQMTKLYTGKYGSRNIRLINIFNNNAANTVLYSDPNRLKQVLRNLLENAYKFTEKGTIEIGVTSYGEDNRNYILFYVKDSGIGIPEDKMDEIFDRFRKLDMNTDKYYSGVGLGLSISKKIVENLGGRIWAESKKGEFSKFIFIIPIETRE